MKFNGDFYKSKYFWLGLLGISFLTEFPWNQVCSIKGIVYLTIIVIGTMSIIGSILDISKYFS